MPGELPAEEANGTRASPKDITHAVHSVSQRPLRFGGFSDVYRAVWRRGTKEVQVALKVLRVVDPPDEKALKRLQREISVWSRLDHPHVHVLYGICTGLGPVSAMVSPWYDNGNINHYLKARANDPEIDYTKLTLLVHVMSGLNYLHTHNIVHGDIKGGNVLISASGTARLCDFGFSTIISEHSQSFTQGTNVKGTCRWMAPELLMEENVRHSYMSDMWACGCLFIEVQSGTVPYFTKNNDHQVILAISRRELPPRPPNIPDFLWTEVIACCKYRPRDRSAAADELISLESHLALARIKSMLARSGITNGPGQELIALVVACFESTLAKKTELTELHALTDPEFGARMLRLLGRWAESELGPQHQLSRVVRICIDILMYDHDSASRSSQVLSDSSLQGIGRDTLRPIVKLIAVTDKRAARLLVMYLCDSVLAPPLKVGCIVFGLAWFPQRNVIAAACEDSNVQIYHSTMGHVSSNRTLKGHTEWVRCVALSHDANTLASCSDDWNIRLWDANTGTARGRPLSGHMSWVSSIVCSPTGQELISGSCDGTIRVWSLETCRTLLELSGGHVQAVNAVAISSDGAIIVSCSRDATLRGWDAGTGQYITPPLVGHSRSVTCVAFVPHTRLAMSGAEDCTLRTWDFTEGVETASSPQSRHFARLESKIWSIACTPDGARVACGLSDGTIRIWDFESGVLVGGSIYCHQKAVRALQFSHDGTQLASGSDDGTIRISDAVDPGLLWD